MPDTTSIIDLADRHIRVEIPNFSGELRLWDVVWAKHILDNVYLMSLRDGAEKSFVMWLVKVFSDGRFELHSSALQMSEDEVSAYGFLRQQGVDGLVAWLKIFEARVQRGGGDEGKKV